MIDDINPGRGWALDLVVGLDVYFPGLAGSFLRSSNERRQVIAASLAVCPPDMSQPAAVREGAEFLARADHRAILLQAFGTVPIGLRGALRRSGPQPHERAFYRRLHDLLSAPPHRQVVQAINQLRSIDVDKLRIALKLPHEVCSANVVDAISNPKEAREIATVIDLLIANGADAAALFEAIRRVANGRALTQVWKRWSRRTTFATHPIAASECYKPITSAAELRELALRYHNCAERYITTVLDGFDAFAEFHGTGRPMVVHLRREEGRWRLEGMFGRNNARPQPDQRTEALNYLRARGVESRPKPEYRRGPWQVLNRLLSPAMFDFEDD